MKAKKSQTSASHVKARVRGPGTHRPHQTILVATAGMTHTLGHGGVATPSLLRLAESGWIGERIYDALHLRCAKKAACDRIYTFNVRPFQQLAPDLADRIGAP